jgi:hypothetical protein
MVDFGTEDVSISVGDAVRSLEVTIEHNVAGISAATVNIVVGQRL